MAILIPNIPALGTPACQPWLGVKKSSRIQGWLPWTSLAPGEDDPDGWVVVNTGAGLVSCPEAGAWPRVQMGAHRGEGPVGEWAVRFLKPWGKRPHLSS